MDDHTRRDVDEACLRLMGWKRLKDSKHLWRSPSSHSSVSFSTPSPSTDPVFVVPLAEALRARGRCVTMVGPQEGKWFVSISIGDEANYPAADADTLHEALAIAAARAVGTENDK